MSGPAAEALRARLAAAPTVGVIGLGYVGLPLAVAFAESGATVLGIDLDARRVAGVGAAQSFIEDVPTEALRAVVRAGRLSASDDYGALSHADAIVICVPTPLGKSKEPDISNIIAAADAVASVARAGQLVVLESTTYPGTTQEVLAPRLEARGLKAGTDIFLAFSPERIDPGNRDHTLRTIPKVVGGLTPTCAALATTLYRRITERVIVVSSPGAAEMVKLLENTFRSVNIALANEFAIMCRRLGISVWEVIGAAATKPFGFMPFYPGPGLGGHCLPSDPHYLSWRVRLAGYEPRFIAFADEVNRQMPTYVVQMVVDALNDRERALRGARVLALGVAYKANVADTRDAPALEIIDALVHKGARVAYHDPHVPSVSINGVTFDSVEWSPRDLGAYDVVLILTPHAGYDWATIVEHARLVIDTRNATAGLGRAPHVIRL
ncbi:MAG: UDP-N-acetyl-D-glucosamine dehydrogenase [Candidatus Rokubacteria bacterium 13_1_20CM_2_70_7]|nr:MAG: UDP-N-acetyl-D-glucosamine dehydrogenase [Candidatus Rokubacteria bacterium 13_1_20CM_2_70_7]